MKFELSEFALDLFITNIILGHSYVKYEFCCSCYATEYQGKLMPRYCHPHHLAWKGQKEEVCGSDQR